jgi:hypothetical protein
MSGMFPMMHDREFLTSAFLAAFCSKPDFQQQVAKSVEVTARTRAADFKTANGVSLPPMSRSRG